MQGGFDLKKLTLIVPCFNEQEALPFFYKEAISVLKNLNYEYELLFINDGSKDNTLNILKDFADRDACVKYISFSRNFGKEAAMYAGFCNATGDYVAIMDADMQDPPDLLPEMLKLIESGEYDSVATRRVSREGEPPIRSWFARRFYSLINKISDADIVSQRFPSYAPGNGGCDCCNGRNQSIFQGHLRMDRVPYILAAI